MTVRRPWPKTQDYLCDIPTPCQETINPMIKTPVHRCILAAAGVATVLGFSGCMVGTAAYYPDYWPGGEGFLYYPSAGIYYDRLHGYYYYPSGGTWIQTSVLPAYLYGGLGTYVVLTNPGPSPWYYYEEHRHNYPPDSYRHHPPKPPPPPPKPPKDYHPPGGDRPPPPPPPPGWRPPPGHQPPGGDRPPPKPPGGARPWPDDRPPPGEQPLSPGKPPFGERPPSPPPGGPPLRSVPGSGAVNLPWPWDEGQGSGEAPSSWPVGGVLSSKPGNQVYKPLTEDTGQPPLPYAPRTQSVSKVQSGWPGGSPLTPALPPKSWPQPAQGPTVGQAPTPAPTPPMVPGPKPVQAQGGVIRPSPTPGVSKSEPMGVGQGGGGGLTPSLGPGMPLPPTFNVNN